MAEVSLVVEAQDVINCVTVMGTVVVVVESGRVAVTVAVDVYFVDLNSFSWIGKVGKVHLRSGRSLDRESHSFKRRGRNRVYYGRG